MEDTDPALAAALERMATPAEEPEPDTGPIAMPECGAREVPTAGCATCSPVQGREFSLCLTDNKHPARLES